MCVYIALCLILNRIVKQRERNRNRERKREWENGRNIGKKEEKNDMQYRVSNMTKMVK